MAPAAASFFLLLLVLMPLGRAFRLNMLKARAKTMKGAKESAKADAMAAVAPAQSPAAQAAATGPQWWWWWLHEGMVVEIESLVAQTQGQIIGWDASTNSWWVKFKNIVPMRIEPKDLKRQIKYLVNTAPQFGPVVLGQLTGDQEKLNGLEAQLLHWDSSTKRWKVRVLESSAEPWVKLENLVPVARASTSLIEVPGVAAQAEGQPKIDPSFVRMATLDSRSTLAARAARFRREEQRAPPPLPANRITISEGKVVTSDKDVALQKLLQRKLTAGVPLTADQQRVLSSLGAKGTVKAKDSHAGTLAAAEAAAETPRGSPVDVPAASRQPHQRIHDKSHVSQTQPSARAVEVEKPELLAAAESGGRSRCSRKRRERKAAAASAEGAAVPALEAAEVNSKVTPAKSAAMPRQIAKVEPMAVPKQTAEVTPVVASSEHAAEVVTEAFIAAVSKTPAEPKPEAAKVATKVKPGTLEEAPLVEGEKPTTEELSGSSKQAFPENLAKPEGAIPKETARDPESAAIRALPVIAFLTIAAIAL